MEERQRRDGGVMEEGRGRGSSDGTQIGAGGCGHSVWTVLAKRS